MFVFEETNIRISLQMGFKSVPVLNSTDIQRVLISP